MSKPGWTTDKRLGLVICMLHMLARDGMMTATGVEVEEDDDKDDILQFSYQLILGVALECTHKMFLRKRN